MISRFQKSCGKLIELNKLCARELHLTRTLRLDPKNVTEVRIPVPWGHLAGKWWGNTNEQPILALHGWQDNASTFDNLLEILPISKPVLAIDSPGHGFSSHFPKGTLYHNANYIMMCRRIQLHFKWNEKITILGHSEGGVIAFLFSAFYPEYVNTLMTLDVIKPFAFEPKNFSQLGELIDECVTKSRRDMSENANYPLEELVERWVKATRGSLTTDAVKVLLRRGAQYDEESGKYSLTRDPKLKIISLQRFDENQCLELASNLNCHYLAVKFSKGKWFDYSLKNSPNFISTVTKATKSFKLANVEGTHHSHLTSPEHVAPIIKEFIDSTS